MDKQDYGVIIVGAGQAGCDVALGLRQQGYSSTIRLVGDENYPPYRRPPLSKTFLAGDATLESLYLRPEASYRDQRIE
jgi:3-phenylpropionate/trans-cinnamate dioxygenase ferredoxin reductase subunit